jgi:hypothetical protein
MLMPARIICSTKECLPRLQFACNHAMLQAAECKLDACASRYCKSGETSLCDTTNESRDMKVLYGDDISGVHGYGHLTGGCASFETSGSAHGPLLLAAHLHIQQAIC